MIIRFFIHRKIEAFADAIVKQFATSSEKAFLFPSHGVAARCTRFLHDQSTVSTRDPIKVIDFYPNDDSIAEIGGTGQPSVLPIISAVIFPGAHLRAAKMFWQHSGDGISSRRAEYCHNAFEDGRLIMRRASSENANTDPAITPSKGPRRYQRTDSLDSSFKRQIPSKGNANGYDCVKFVEERFGRNLDISLAASAKLAIRRRIAGALTANVDLDDAVRMSHLPTRMSHVKGFSENDVYLYSCGMSSIFNTHRTLMVCRGQLKSISFG